jgi:hypothetical protein
MESALAPSLAAAAEQLDNNPAEQVFWIKEHVFLGTRYGAEDRQLLDRLGIRAVINLSAGRTRIPKYFEGKGIEYLHIELTDELLSNPTQAIPRAYHAIRKWGMEPRCVLVHCSAGLSRSATAVLAWLMRDGGLSLAAAKDLLAERRGRRPRCNPSFWCYLAALEREIHGWPTGTSPSFDFTPWLLEDLKKMGMRHQDHAVAEALRRQADWVDFTSFYTALSGNGFKSLMMAQVVAQRPKPDVRTACKAVNVALELMEVYHAWPAVQAFCLRLVQPLLAHSEGRPAEHAFAGGLTMKTLTAMRAHPEVADVQEAGCGTLAYLAASSVDFAKDILLLGGLEAMLAGMTRHPESADVQATGCLGLTTLLCSVGCGKEMSSRGGVKVVLQAMRRHRSSEKVQLCACRVLGSLTTRSATALEVSQAGGAELVVAALKAHPNHPGVCQCASEALVGLQAVGGGFSPFGHEAMKGAGLNPEDSIRPDLTSARLPGA